MPMPTNIALAMARVLTIRWPFLLKALQGHPKASALLEKDINKILDGLDITYSTHE
jgi:hypothetical protein